MPGSFDKWCQCIFKGRLCVSSSFWTLWQWASEHLNTLLTIIMCRTAVNISLNCFSKMSSLISTKYSCPSKYSGKTAIACNFVLWATWLSQGPPYGWPTRKVSFTSCCAQSFDEFNEQYCYTEVTKNQKRVKKYLGNILKFSPVFSWRSRQSLNQIFFYLFLTILVHFN